jgi:hypothetical protein
MQQIADWLEKLGLSEYAQRIAKNDIDFEVFCGTAVALSPVYITFWPGEETVIALLPVPVTRP